MTHNFHILYFLCKSKLNQKGQSPIFCRITFDSNRKQFSTGHFVNTSSWNSKLQHYKGNSKEAQRVNENFTLIKQKLYKAFNDVSKEKDILFIDDIYNRFSGTDKEYKTLLQAFEYHNQKMESLIGKEYVQATYGKFVVIQTHIKEFIRYNYNKSDYALFDLKLNFLADLDYYLKIQKSLNQNTINKLIERVKKVVKIALGDGWISSDPFILYHRKSFTKEVVFLSNSELIKQLVTTDEAGGYTLTAPENIASQYTLGTDIIYRLNIGKALSFTNTFDLSYNRFSGMEAAAGYSQNGFWNYRLHLEGSINLPQKFIFLAHGEITGPQALPQGYMNQNKSIDIELKRLFYNRKITVSAMLSDIFKDRRQSSYINTLEFTQDNYFKENSRMLHLSYSF